MFSHPIYTDQAKRTPRIQASLRVGQPGDKYEKQADMMADRIMSVSAGNEVVQRQCASCAGEEIQMKTLPGQSLQMQPIEEEEEMMQPKLQMQPIEEEEEEMIQSKTAKGKLHETSISENSLASAGNGDSLPGNTLQQMGQAFGNDFSSVRVHTDSQSANMNRQLGARAFTYGKDIYFNKGEYQPGSQQGDRLLAHELTHVVQQGASEKMTGSVAPKIQMDRLTCTSRKKLEVYTVNLPGSTRTAFDDIKATNDILCQCGLEIVIKGGESWDTDLMDKQDPKGVLNEFKSIGNPTLEEKELLAHRPGGNMLHLYYVPALSDGNEAEAFNSSGFPTVHNGLVVTNGARIFAFAHELGHVLLDDGSHHANKDNLMASGGVNSGKGELTEEQCAKMP